MAPVITPARDTASAEEIRTLISALRKTCLFQHASESALFRLAMEMERVRFGPGDVLGAVEGAPQTHLFVVTAGRLARRSAGRLVDESSYGMAESLVEDAPFEDAAESSSSSSLGGDGLAEATAVVATAQQQQTVVRAVSETKPSGNRIRRGLTTRPSRPKSTVDIMCPDRPGLVANVASALRAQGLSIENSTLKTTRTGGGDGADSGQTMATAYQVHEVVDGTTHEPIEDPARMRRVEAAVLRALEKNQGKQAILNRASAQATSGSGGGGGKKKNENDADGGGGGGSNGEDGQESFFFSRTIVPSNTNDEIDVNSFGTLQCLGELPSFATTTAITSGVCWRLSSKSLESAIRAESDRDLAVDIASGLAAEVFRMSNTFSTPLFEQPVQKVNVAAVSVAAAFESYYRSALNAYLNAAISTAMNGGGPARKVTLSLAQLFPEMHVQIPTRVMYINGFKLTRHWLADLVEEPAAAATARGDERARAGIMLIPALLPGVLMTPLSSILEATNAGHSNPEPLSRRWVRGITARSFREIIFGVGLNNLTDWAEERIPRDLCEGKVMRNALGSVTAGVVAGYFSHVPHNLSTMKLLQPQKSYGEHVSSLVRASGERVPSSLPPSVRSGAAAALAILLPKGLGIRTTQVVGSFVLLNGISHLLDR